MRGDVFRLLAPRGTRGSEQSGRRYAVILQSEDLYLSTVIVAPTSCSANSRIFRPTVTVAQEETQVLLEQLTAVAPERLGELVGHLSQADLAAVDDGLRLVLALD